MFAKQLGLARLLPVEALAVDSSRLPLMQSLAPVGLPQRLATHGPSPIERTPGCRQRPCPIRCVV